VIGRLLFIAVVIVALYWLLRSFLKRPAANDESSPSQVKDMVRCAQCGVHLPKEESVTAGSRFFCCEDHRRAFENRSE
jgi:uncharacterized protein